MQEMVHCNLLPPVPKPFSYWLIKARFNPHIHITAGCGVLEKQFILNLQKWTIAHRKELLIEKFATFLFHITRILAP
jgi:hypothetical protein